MTKIKLCGLSRPCDIEVANELMPEYVGFVFAKQSRRYVNFNTAGVLKNMLNKNICAVGVFVNENPEVVSDCLNRGIIDMAQLHGNEGIYYIEKLKTLTKKPIIKAMIIRTEQDISSIENCGADHVLLDAGAGEGRILDFTLLRNVDRPYFLAGGLNAENVDRAIQQLSPYAVDVSSGIETGGLKDEYKMTAFISAVRRADFA